MPRIHPESLRKELAVWVAAGGRLSTWCDEHGVARRAASDWYKKDSFQRRVEESRRRAVDRAIGKMARNLGKAVAMIVHLIEDGQTDTVKLSAAKTLIDKLLEVRGHAELKAELQRLNERLAAQEQRRASGPRQTPGAGDPA